MLPVPNLLGSAEPLGPTLVDLLALRSAHPVHAVTPVVLNVRDSSVEDRHRVGGFQEVVGDNEAAPAEQLQSIRIALDVTAYRKWDFREMGVSRAFLSSGPLVSDTYAQLPDGAEEENAACGLLKPFMD